MYLKFCESINPFPRDNLNLNNSALKAAGSNMINLPLIPTQNTHFPIELKTFNGIVKFFYSYSYISEMKLLTLVFESQENEKIP